MIDPNNGFQVIMENVVAIGVGLITGLTVYRILLRKLDNKLRATTFAGIAAMIPIVIVFTIAEGGSLRDFVYLLALLLVYAYVYVHLVWRARDRIQKSKEEKVSKDIK